MRAYTSRAKRVAEIVQECTEARMVEILAKPRTYQPATPRCPRCGHFRGSRIHRAHMRSAA